MQFKQNHARPLVLRELSLLRALGASLRTSSYHPSKFRRPSRPLSVLPRPDTLAVLPRPLPSEKRP
jgi:hypothetical protein